MSSLCLHSKTEICKFFNYPRFSSFVVISRMLFPLNKLTMWCICLWLLNLRSPYRFQFFRIFLFWLNVLGHNRKSIESMECYSAIDNLPKNAVDLHLPGCKLCFTHSKGISIWLYLSVILDCVAFVASYNCTVTTRANKQIFT